MGSRTLTSILAHHKSSKVSNKPQEREKKKNRKQRSMGRRRHRAWIVPRLLCHGAGADRGCSARVLRPAQRLVRWVQDEGIGFVGYWVYWKQKRKKNLRWRWRRKTRLWYHEVSQICSNCILQFSAVYKRSIQKTKDNGPNKLI